MDSPQCPRVLYRAQPSALTEVSVILGSLGEEEAVTVEEAELCWRDHLSRCVRTPLLAGWGAGRSAHTSSLCGCRW